MQGKREHGMQSEAASDARRPWFPPALTEVSVGDLTQGALDEAPDGEAPGSV